MSHRGDGSSSAGGWISDGVFTDYKETHSGPARVSEGNADGGIGKALHRVPAWKKTLT